MGVEPQRLSEQWVDDTVEIVFPARTRQFEVDILALLLAKAVAQDIGETLKNQFPEIEIWAVEPENAAILSGGNIGTHLQMGIGDGIIPPILNQSIYSNIYIVTDEEAIDTARQLARLEGIMCGISSGTNVAAALKLAEKLGEGKTVVTVLPDTAERYFSTVLFEE